MSSNDAKNILWFVTVPLGIIAIGLVTLSVMRYMKKPEKVIKKFEWLRTFYIWIGALAILGGTWAFFLPIAINSGFNKDDDGPVLRQLLIYTVGGILGVITLGETHRKNNLEKDKSDQDHTRQVHAERRSRYTKAIEHLFNENISIRLGGVYTLAGLADEWLSDEKTLRNKKKRRKETQNIINNLCAYIRSPFDLASRAEVLSQDQTPENYEGGAQQFVKDQAKFREEKELRLIILDAIKTRLSGGTEKLIEGPWSNFDYDFSNARFFYPVNFANSYFSASSDFSQTIFTQDAGFFNSRFTQNADFLNARFTQHTNFRATTFNIANFSWTTFTQKADFRNTIFTRRAGFSNATFTEGTDFSKAKFNGDADFSDAIFQNADFLEVIFDQNAGFLKTSFTGRVSLFNATFTQNANFVWATFTGDADFSKAKFIRNANFARTTFTGDADFSKAKFIRNANFARTTFTEKPIFERALGDKTCKARFSCKADPEDYNFKVSHNSPYKIETKEQEHNGIKFVIPEGAELFDPDEPSEQDNNDDN